MLRYRWAPCRYVLRPPVGAFVIFLLSAITFPQQSAIAIDDGAIAGPAATAKPFDIPSQPLEDALYAFDAATGIEVFVDGSVVAGRRSTAIKGLFTPAQALRALLAGTGIEAKSIGPDAITLSAADPEESAGSQLYRNYSALLQAAVLRVLCAERDIRPGAYRIAAQLWLGPDGGVSAANLLSSTGDRERDKRLHGVLAGISIGRALPPGLPQPVIMVVLPRLPQESGDCS